MITQEKNGFTRRIDFRPGYHKVHEDPKKDFGVHGMEIWFYLIGKKGAVHFGISTGMMLKETKEWWKATGRDGSSLTLFPMGIDVGYHSPTPQFEGQEVVWPKKRIEKIPYPGLNAKREEIDEYYKGMSWEKIGDKPPVCEYLGVPCYSDGSALRAEKYENIFLEKGDEEIWKLLEEDYAAYFK